jgi:hypothetical protein
MTARYFAAITLFNLIGWGVLPAQHTLEGYRAPVTTFVFESENDTLSIATIIRQHTGLFYSTESLGTANQGHAYWFRLDFREALQKFPDQDTLFLITGLLDRAEVFYGQEALQSRQLDYTGKGLTYPRNELTSVTVPIAVNALLEDRYVFIKILYNRGSPNLKGFGFYYNTPLAEYVHQNFVRPSFIKNQIPIFILIGIASLLLIFNLLLFRTNKERQYLYYSAFLLFQVMYYSRSSPVVSQFLFGEHYSLKFLLTEIAQVGANVSYVLFVKHFLETRKNLPLLNKVLNGVAIGLGLFILVDTVLLVNNPFFLYQSHLMYAQRYIMGAFAIVGVVYLLIKAKGNLRFFIIGGTTCYAGGALATMFLLELNYMLLGSALENIIFALGLSYKIKAINREKLTLEQEANQVRLSALRAQMNPHFIFNSLNSIQHLISKNDKASALKYLTKFSTLLRQILESSLHVNIPIKDEIELLRIYIELELLRFDHAFHYSIDVDDKLDVYNLEVPILLLQPYVENAIGHGLLPKQEGRKELTISFADHDTFVKCVIHDTGIGRLAAMERRQNSKNARPSRGMELTRQRIRLISKEFSLDELLTIEDSSEGTTVTIKIPKN